MGLYQVASAIRDAYENPEVMDPLTGELLKPEVLEALESDKRMHVLWRAKLADELTIEAANVEAVAYKLLKRAQAYANRAEWLKQQITEDCSAGEKFRDDEIRFHVGESQACEIVDESKVPNGYWVQPDTPPKRIDKKELLKDLKVKRVQGAALKTTKFVKFT